MSRTIWWRPSTVLGCHTVSPSLRLNAVAMECSLLVAESAGGEGGWRSSTSDAIRWVDANPRAYDCVRKPKEQPVDVNAGGTNMTMVISAPVDNSPAYVCAMAYSTSPIAQMVGTIWRTRVVHVKVRTS